MGEYPIGRYPAVHNKFGRTISLSVLASALYINTIISHEGADLDPSPLPGVSADMLSPPGEASDRLQLIDRMPGEHGPCFRDNSLNRRKLQIGAKACLAAYDHGEIALVNYGVHPRQAEKVAKDMAAIISSSTAGLARPSVTVIPASPAAKQKLRETTKAKGCIDEETGSAVADETMPELKVKDFVVALNTLHACTPLNGVARGWRRSDIFTYAADPALKTGRTSPGNPAAVTGAHEWLHTVRIGHAGSLYSMPAKVDLGKKHIAQAPGTFDLKEYVSKSYRYEEYSKRSNNPMGAGSWELASPHQAQLNPVQLEALRWPYSQLGDQAASRAHLITKDWTVLHESRAHDAAFMTIPLAESVTLKPTIEGKGYPDAPKLFDTLNIVPVTDASSGKKVRGVRILLSNEDADTVDLGPIMVGDNRQTSPYQIKFGAQTIQLQMDPTTIQARTVAVS